MKISDLATTLNNRDFAPVEIIGGLFPRNYTTIIASKSGVGKTWLMLKLACDMSVGGTICSMLAEKEPQRKILIFSGETGTELLNKRLSMTKWNFEPSNIKIYDLNDCVNAGYILFFNEEVGQRTIWEIMNYEHPDVVFIDTLISFNSGDENTAKDMAPLFGFVNRLAKSFNCAVVVMHHTRKKQQGKRKEVSDQDEIIGSSALNRNIASAFIIVRDNKERALEKINIVNNVKTWNEEIQPFMYTITKFTGQIDMKFTSAVNATLTIHQKIDDFITHMIEGRKYTVKEIAETVKTSKEYARSLLHDYEKKGVLTWSVENIDGNETHIFTINPEYFR